MNTQATKGKQGHSIIQNLVSDQMVSSSPILQIAKWTQVFWAELLQHLAQLVIGVAVDWETVTIHHAGVAFAESLEKYAQMRERKTMNDTQAKWIADGFEMVVAVLGVLEEAYPKH